MSALWKKSNNKNQNKTKRNPKFPKLDGDIAEGEKETK